ncbi:MAG TPA: hypothetical protein VMS18_08885 [Candidatus Binatia bacterium]|nr:hypothetical protein [Candidatus Binatia bacterium]
MKDFLAKAFAALVLGVCVIFAIRWMPQPARFVPICTEDNCMVLDSQTGVVYTNSDMPPRIPKKPMPGRHETTLQDKDLQ